MLKDHEQRALEELERSFAGEAREPVRSGPTTPPGRSRRPAGFRVVLVMTCVSVALVFASVPEAGLALAGATAMGWLFWRLWSRRGDAGPGVAPPVVGSGSPEGASAPRWGASIWNYLVWLSEE